MDSFGNSAWARKEFSSNYLDKADIYILERGTMIDTVSSLFTHFYSGRTGVRVLPDMKERAALFKYVAGHLNSGGYFVNADVVLSPSEELEGWYFKIWKDWMQNMFDRFDIRDEKPEDVITKFKDPASMNRPDKLTDQLSALKEAGFMDVDCYFKIGIFVIFGGEKV